MRALSPTLGVLLIGARAAVAADYYVSPTGNDANAGTSWAQPWQTILRAKTVVAPGDTVHVADGTYAGFWTDVSGTPSAPITWKADGSNVVIDRPPATGPSPNNDNIKLIWADYNIVDGFKVKNAPRAGISVLGSDTDLIEGCIVRNCDSGFNQKWGLIDWYAKSVLYEFNVFHDSIDEHGLYHGDNGDDAIIRSNICYGNRSLGIHNLGGFPGGLGDGINSRCLIENNIIHSNGYGGGAGIDGDGVQDNIYRNNLIFDQHASGIILFQYGSNPSKNNLIVNNTIVMASDGRWAIKIVDNATGNVVFNNILYHAGNNGAIAIDASSLPGFVSDHNVVVDRFSTDGDASTISLAQWRAQTGQDASSLAIDAATLASYFVAPGSNDWHLKAGSAAIDAGLPALAGHSAPTRDYESDARPQGAGFDIGCDEYFVQAPRADFSATPQSGPAPLHVQFTDLCSYTTGWSWSFGDGGTSSASSPSHDYLAPGLYTVSLTATGPGGSDTETRPGYIVVTGPAPRATILSGRGRGAGNPNDVRIHGLGAVQHAAWTAYGAGQWGTLTAASDIDGSGTANPLTGPGPGPIYGPQVRAFEPAGTALPKVNFYAYGTLRYGVNVGGGDIDGLDAPAELVTGPGPGAVFGPHVRGFDYDGAQLAAITKVSFYAYGTLRYGVNVATGDLDGDGDAELVTGPGPSGSFGAQVRAFTYGGTAVTALAKVNFQAFGTNPAYGAVVSAGAMDGDGFDEILVGRGAGPSQGTQVKGFNVDAASVAPLPGFDVTPYLTLFGARVAAGDLDGDGIADLVTGPGEDPTAAASVRAYDYTGAALAPITAGSFDAFPSSYGVIVAAGTFGF